MARSIFYLSSDSQQWLQLHAGNLIEIDPAPAHRDIVVVADFVEEALVPATLPKLFGGDSSTLVERRLATEFRETPYRTSYPLGAGRAAKTIDYIFLGLPNAKAIDGWLKPLQERGQAIAAVLTVSMLAAWWVQRSGVERRILLILLPTPAGIRHIFLRDGKPVLSRLTSAADLSTADMARSLAEEVERTVLYLYNARVIERGQDIPTWVWGSEPACMALPERQVTGVVYQPTPQIRALADPATGGLGALLTLAAEHRLPTQLAPDALRVHYFAGRARRGLGVAASVAALLLLALSLNSVWGSRALRQENSALQDQIAALQAQQALLAEQAEGLNADPQTVHDAMQAHQRLLEHAPSLDHWLRLVSVAFDASPAFRLDQLDWQLARATAATGSTGAATISCPVQIESGDGLALDSATRPDLIAGLRLSGQLEDNIPLREALLARRLFEAPLRSRSEFRTDSDVAPEGLSSDGMIRGGGTSDSEAREFSYCLSGTATP